MRSLLAAASVLIGLGSPAMAASWAVDPAHTQITFSYDHLGFSTTHGAFRDFHGTFDFDPKAPQNSSVAFTIEADSLDTMFAQRDEHLKSADFLDVAKFPEITFKSTKVTRVGETGAKVDGDLTVKGITKPVVLDVQLTKLGEHPMTQKESAGFVATTTIKRSEFGVDGYVPAVSDALAVRIDMEASTGK
jgi:polyisoprenoid-binding protein YceI